ncbi:MAG: MoaD/ThiS family protein [Candidatus Ranarchaeia archaeon]
MGFKNHPITIPEGSTIEILFQILDQQFPNFKRIVLSPQQKLGETYRILVNGRSIRHLRKFRTALADGDIVAIFPVIPTR